MTKSPQTPTRADVVRQRRSQTQAKTRYEHAGTRPSASVRPLVSVPRAPTPALRKTGARRQFNASAPALPALRLPALPQVNVSWRLASLSLVILLGALLVRLLTAPQLFVDGINLGGNSLVPGEEIYAQSGVARQNIFWVDPRAAAKAVEAVPGIASATVTVKWPNTVTLVVQERVPVILWEEGDRQWWVDANGFKFKSRGELPGLLPVMVDDVLPGTAVSDTEVIPPEAVAGAILLKQLRPNIELLHYDTLHGLSYQDGRSWRGYFGVGLDMAEKLAVYETLVENLVSRGIHPSAVSVEDLRQPYYRK